MLNSLVEKLATAQSVVLTTHRHSDGDGLGAQTALYLGLRKLGFKVRAVNVDRPAKKYSFLGLDDWLEIYGEDIQSLPETDLALVLDTNDRRLVEPLFTELRSKCHEVIFVDHHPILNQGPSPTLGSVIDVSAASTGEISYFLLQKLGVEFDAEIARALYTSLVFDTQLFRFVKSGPQSHLIAAELLKYERTPEEVHQKLFANYSVEKMGFVSKALTQVEYRAGNRVAFLHLKSDDFREKGLDPGESGDIIDFMMNVGSVRAAALLREEAPGHFKLSLRGKSGVEVLPLAETLGGGGHSASAGAYFEGVLKASREEIIRGLERLVDGEMHRSRE